MTDINNLDAAVVLRQLREEASPAVQAAMALFLKMSSEEQSELLLRTIAEVNNRVTRLDKLLEIMLSVLGLNKIR